MAFELINKYTDVLAEKYKNSGKSEYLFALVSYYETVLKTAKFRGQREYCKSVIKQIEPSFYKGYFKK